VIGAAFYIMSMEEGRVFWDGGLPGMSPDERGAIYRAKIGTLAKLHSPTIRRRSGSATSASREIISPGRSIAGPSSIAPRRRTRSRRWTG
jgi:aminoglycoside phosphotransferase (APT) family kinase protein